MVHLLKLKIGITKKESGAILNFENVTCLHRDVLKLGRTPAANTIIRQEDILSTAATLLHVSGTGLRIRIRTRIILGSRIRIQINIRVKSWIRIQIHIKVKIQEL
jgi:hypothetical protein